MMKQHRRAGHYFAALIRGYAKVHLLFILRYPHGATKDSVATDSMSIPIYNMITTSTIFFYPVPGLISIMI